MAIGQGKPDQTQLKQTACLPWTAIRIMNKPLIMFAHQNTALFGIDLRVDPLDVLIALPKYLW